MPFVAPFGSAPRVFCVVFVNFCLHFSLFLHCFSRKILIFCSLRATIITFITIIPQFAAIFKCFPSPTPTNSQNAAKFHSKVEISSPKIQIYHPDSKKSPSSAAITVHNQDVSPYSRFFFVFITLTSIYLIFNAPRANHHKFRSNYNHKSILFTRSVSINRPSTSKTAAPQSSPFTKTFFIQQNAGATTTSRQLSSPTSPRCVSIDQAHPRVVAHFTN